MSFVLSEYDVADALTTLRNEYRPVPHLDAAAVTLANLVVWANNNSDGWPYWGKPRQASAKLQAAVKARVLAARYSNDGIVDATAAELRAWQTPVKSFLTRQGVNHATIIVTPEA